MHYSHKSHVAKAFLLLLLKPECIHVIIISSTRGAKPQKEKNHIAQAECVIVTVTTSLTNAFGV